MNVFGEQHSNCNDTPSALDIPCSSGHCSESEENATSAGLSDSMDISNSAARGNSTSHFPNV